MKAQAPTPDIITGLYDFEDNGGAQGVIGLNAFIPSRSIVTMHVALGDVVPVGGPGATIGTGVVGDANAFLADTAFAAFGNGSPIAGVDLQAAPLYFADAVEMVIIIAGADLIEGRFFVNAHIWQMPSPLS